jgi:hypothetical protein
MNKNQLKAVLESETILPEEREMWLDAGFYVPMPHAATEGILYRSDGNTEGITSKSARLLREATIERWLAHRQEKIRVVEIDPHFESLIERGQE